MSAGLAGGCGGRALRRSVRRTRQVVRMDNFSRMYGKGTARVLSVRLIPSPAADPVDAARRVVAVLVGAAQDHPARPTEQRRPDRSAT